MRANQTNRRLRVWRKLTGIATAAALALSVLGGTVQAADSRILYIGTALVNSSGAVIDNYTNPTSEAPPDGIPDNAGVLSPTPVNAGYSTAVPIQVMNGDNQNIAHVVLSFPASGQLAAGLTITDVGGVDAASCPKVIDPITSAVTAVSCDFGNLQAGAVRSFFVVVATTAATSGPTALFSARVTTNNESGSNLQVFAASSGAFQVQAVNANALSTFVAPGQDPQNFGTNQPGGASKLQTQIDFNQSGGGNLVAIAETEGTSFLYTCPVGLVCQPAETTITIQDGLSGVTTDFANAPFLTVTLTALVPKTYVLSKAFVAHYETSATPYDWILTWANRSTRCGTDIAAKLATVDECFRSATLSKPNSNGLSTLVLQVVVTQNGGYKF